MRIAVRAVIFGTTVGLLCASLISAQSTPPASHLARDDFPPASNPAVGEPAQETPPEVMAMDGVAARALQRKLSRVDFRATPFHEVTARLEGTLAIGIRWQTSKLADERMRGDEPITLHLSSVRTERALELIVVELSLSNDARIAYEIRGGALVIGPPATLHEYSKLHTRTYDVRDLLTAEARLLRWQARVEGLIQVPTTRPAGATGTDAESPFGRAPAAPGAEPYGQAAGVLEDLIEQSVEPDSWTRTGGGEATIESRRGTLVVYQSNFAHRQIEALLRALRSAGANEEK